MNPVITQNDYSEQLREFFELTQETIDQIQSGIRMNKNKEISDKANQLKEQLKPLIQQIAQNGDTQKYIWQHLKSLIVLYTRDTLSQMQAAYPYQKTSNSEGFEDELDIVLQFICGFDLKPPFTLQRICELLVQPQKHYKSTKKILFAMEKLVNVSTSSEKRCMTPSTDANQSHIFSDTYLSELLKLVFEEGSTYHDLSEYFQWTFAQIENIQELISNVEKALSHFILKSLVVFQDLNDNPRMSDFSLIIQLLYKSYHNCLTQHTKLQDILNHYSNHQHVNCYQLCKNVYIETILQDITVIELLKQLECQFKIKFNRDRYPKAHKYWLFIIALPKTVKVPIVREYTRPKIQEIVQIVQEPPKIKEQISEIRAFEIQIETSLNREPTLIPNISQKWINSLKKRKC